MNKDNDLIRRGDVLGLLHAFVCGAKKYDANGCKSELEKICCEELSKAVVGVLGDFEKLMGELPAAPQPMSAVEYARVCRLFNYWCANRLCSECDFFADCPNTGIEGEEATPEQSVEAIQKWPQGHLERST